MNPIHNPFTRDAYPALTDAINGVVNGQPRPVEDPITEDAMTAERDAELRGKMKREKDYGEYRKLRAQREKEAKSKKLYGKGGKVDTSRKPDVSKSKQIWEAESPTEGKKPSNPFNPTLGDLLRSKQQDKKAPKGKPVKEAVTAAQQKVFARERERMLNALNNPKQKLSPTEREAVLARGARNAAAETRKGAVSPTGEKSPIHSAAKAHHEYARRESKKLDAIVQRKVHEDIQTPERAEQQRKRIKSAERGVIFGSRYGRADRTGRLRQLQRIDAREKADTKTTWGVSEPHHMRGHDESTPRKTRKRKVQEGAQLDERIIDEVDFFQASKNLLTGKGFKTNREVSGARVNANMAAMQRRKARAAKKKG